MKVSSVIFSAFTALWIVVLGWAVWPVAPPLEFSEADAIWPKVVKVGGQISITRSFSVTRSDAVTIVRALIKGDCAKSCETVDLPSSVVHLAEGHHRTQTRDFILPLTVDPGLWRVVFVVQGTDRVGRSHRLALKELPFTVVP